MEYLAAADIVERFNARELTEDQLINDVFSRRWPEPAWEEVLLLITGMVPERFAGQIIDHLIAADPLWFLRPGELPRHALLAVRCMGEIRKLGVLSTQSIAVTDTVISLLEASYEHGGSFMTNSLLTQEIEQTVLPVFAELGPYWPGRDRYQDWCLLRGQLLITSMFPSDLLMSLAARIGAALLADSHRLHKILQTQTAISPHKTVRQAAVRVLADGWRNNPGTLPLLRERASIDPSERVRKIAVQELAAEWRDDPGTLPLLRDRATSDPAETVRDAAVDALANGWREDPLTLPLLCEFVTADQHESVRRTAVRALAIGWIDAPETRSLLRKCATIDHAEYVSVRCGASLG